ncbi:MAG: phosphatidylserine/phosphatidylglycerophosphate/cardiolipin synthase family protein [Halobacteriovoraceae bacterium]|jgi:phosphatidylserine/phosphatidylglycerophosphate/cardiolipin synthase-like enzyme|nr:phosphatidylserine/phosphatidylglycerophosphate/cardiolipin synthase family protein [Halobacteriovoraceae bacterium]
MILRKIFSLFFLFSFSVLSATDFNYEKGNYSYSQDEITQSLRAAGIKYFSVGKNQKNDLYKLNHKKQFQIKNWFDKKWFSLQENYEFNHDEFIHYFSDETFNQAKINYYSQFNFNKRLLIHEQELNFFKEWGGLNHPPVSMQLNQLEKYSRFYHPIDYEDVPSTLYTESFHKKLDNISNTELSFNNEVYLLEDKKSYAKKIELIKNAKKHIFMSTLIFADDKSSSKLTDELILKANNGVAVYVIVDDLVSTIGTKRSNIKKMKKSPIHLIEANDFFKYYGSTVYHNKKLVVDFEQAIVGGQNILDADNISNGIDFKNRDLDLYVIGPLVSDIANGFLEDFNYFHKKLLIKFQKKLSNELPRHRKVNPARISFMIRKNLSKYLAWKKSLHKLDLALNASINLQKNQSKRGAKHYGHVLSDPELRTKGVCRFVQQAPYSDLHLIGKTYLHYLNNTKSYLGIMNPQVLDQKYKSKSDRKFLEKNDRFIMYDKLHDQVMSMAEEDDFHIDLLTSGPEVAGNEATIVLVSRLRRHLKSNSIFKANIDLYLMDWVNNHFGNTQYTNLLRDYAPKENIDVWAHISYLHSKVFYFDRLVASVGSYNMHHNATDHTFENTIFCQDVKLNKQLDEIFVRDMVNSIPLKFNKIIN